MPDTPITRVLRPGLVPGAHPEEPNTWLVLEPTSGNVFELSELVWEVAQEFDGAKSAREIADHLEVGRRHVQEVLRRLEALDLLADPAPASEVSPVPPPQWRRGPVPEVVELEVHPKARFRCIAVGLCCERGYVIPVRPDQVEPLRAAARAKLSGDSDPVTLWPSEPGEPWGYALENDEGCPFLDAQRLCGVHETPAQPDACQVFPMVYARVGSRVLASLSYRCGCGIGGDGPLLSEQTEEIERRLRLSPHIPEIPAVARLDARRTVDGARALDVFVEVAGMTVRGAEAPWARLRAVLEGLLEASEDRSEATAPGALGSLRARLVEVAGEGLAPVLEGQPAVAPFTLAERLAEASIRDKPKGVMEVSRFVRDHLFGARPFQQATLTHGLALLSALVADLTDEREGLVATRARLMAWDDVIPQTEVRAALVRAEVPETEDAAALLSALRAREEAS